MFAYYLSIQTLDALEDFPVRRVGPRLKLKAASPVTKVTTDNEEVAWVS
jgi:hypothetical protein